MYASDEELRKFFGFMVWPKYKLPVEKIRKNVLESLQLFSWKERYQNIRKEFTEEFEEPYWKQHLQNLNFREPKAP